MSRQTIKARLDRLAGVIVPMEHGGVIVMRDTETFEEACRRLGVTDGGYLVVREPLPPDQWNGLARLQQSMLIRGDV